MKRLSIVLATFNEEKNLPKCLESVKDIADEILIVDGTSQDNTVKIAKEYGAKVYIRENPQVFHINKQIAIDKAEGMWILQLDADEVVSKELKEEIKKIINPPSKTKDPRPKTQHLNGYWIPRKNYFLGRFLTKGGQYPDYTIRLYKRGKGKLPQKDVHEQAIVEGEVEYLKSPLLHFPYKNFKDYLRKWNVYNELLATQIKEHLEGKSIATKFLSSINYLVIKPLTWFTSVFVRHKGFMDSWQGFVFALFSSIRFPISYVKYVKK